MTNFSTLGRSDRSWFVPGRTAELRKPSMLEKFEKEISHQMATEVIDLRSCLVRTSAEGIIYAIIDSSANIIHNLSLKLVDMKRSMISRDRPIS